uniref:GPI transamidase component PIG-S isoform X3 n=1 Tax=Elaeis guineensis var. tenera TaxID=51953 RepID=A0A8N4EZC5_ELAGV|nr:GPI transamidase component PIG-S isoform X3 [Elaeis guineensis]
MAEDSGAALNPCPPSAAAADGDSTRRTARPGTKRLLLTLSVLLSFLSGLPFLLKSTEIYRSPLPFRSIDSLSSRLQSDHPTLPCRFQAVLLRPDADRFLADRLGSLISEDLVKRTSNDPVSGGCGKNFSVSVTIDSGAGCVRSSVGAGDACLWRCGVADFSGLGGGDEDVDELLDSALREGSECLGSGGGRVYTVVVIERDVAGEGVQVVVGKHRHAWLVGKVSEPEAVSMIGKIFVEIFMNGGKKAGEIGKAEFMPVGADGSVVLSFSLLNADPSDWVYNWEFQKIEKIMLAPVVEALAPIANITVESQVLYHTPKSSISYWDKKLGSYIFTMRDLPFFVNSNEWHLDTSITAAGQSKVLQFVELQKIFQVFIGQLRLLFGLRSNYLDATEMGISRFLNSERGFTEWELDLLYRHHTCFNLLSCATTLESLSKLVQSLPRMIIMDEIGKQVKFSLEAASLALRNASLGIYDASAVSARKARALAEDAFFHPSIMSISYSSIEHYFAIYMPFFAPVSLHVLLAAIKELKRYKRERAKYLTSADQARAAS